jgi:hypothetical protein
MLFVMVCQRHTLKQSLQLTNYVKNGQSIAHFKTNGHATKECKALLAQVKKLLALYKPKTSLHSYKYQKTDYNKSKSKLMKAYGKHLQGSESQRKN